MEERLESRLMERVMKKVSEQLASQQPATSQKKGQWSVQEQGAWKVAQVKPSVASILSIHSDINNIIEAEKVQQVGELRDYASRT